MVLIKKSPNIILPNLPGVYFFKNAQGEIIYIGKAISLRSRVGSYFANYQKGDWKIDAIIEEYADIDFIITPTEQEALLMEAELIQKHKPRFNTLFKTGQPFVYLLFSKGKLPTIKIVRNKKQKGAHFGPFLHKTQARKVHQFLMRTFKLNTCNKKIENGCLDYHLGNCAGTCKKAFDISDYLFRLELAKKVLKNQDQDFIESIEHKIKEYSVQMAFEKAKRLAHYLEHTQELFDTIRIKYSAANYATDIFVATTPASYVAETHEAVSWKLSELLGLVTPIRTIDCFDISHFQSHSIVGSCVRFKNGKPDKNKFRRFKIKTLEQQNDYAALREIVSRRYKDGDDLPDLILIDGGKGQLNAVKDLYPKAQWASLAKREERLYSNHNLNGIVLDIKTDVGKLLIAIRDYAHHFAITYHRLHRSKQR